VRDESGAIDDNNLNFVSVMKDVGMPIAAVGAAALGVSVGVVGGTVWLATRNNELGALQSENHRLHEEINALHGVQDSAAGHLQYTPPHSFQISRSLYTEACWIKDINFLSPITRRGTELRVFVTN